MGKIKELFSDILEKRAVKIERLEKRISALREEWDAIDNGTQCDKQHEITKKITLLQKEIEDVGNGKYDDKEDKKIIEQFESNKRSQ